MNQREKLLSGLVGALFVIGAVVYFGDMYLDERSKLITDKEAMIKKRQSQKTDIKLGIRATEDLAALEARALPWDQDDAQRLYQAWLMDTLDKKVGFPAPDVATGVPKNEKVFITHQFTVTCKGDVEKLTKFLYNFYSVDLLHYFDSINVRQIRESRELSLTFVIRAVALPNSPTPPQLSPEPSGRLLADNLDDYIHSIVYRNPFGLKNNGPKLNVGSKSVKVALNETLNIKPSASDPDKGDKVSFDADLEELPKARIDPKTGALTWKPDELGKRQITIYATDNGFPPETSAVDVMIEVVEPPKPPVEAPKARGFDTAKLAVVSAIIQTRGKPQVWVSVRSEGKLLKLNEGDNFEVGFTNATVTEIKQRQFQFKTKEGEMKIVELGQNLADAQEVSAGE